MEFLDLNLIGSLQTLSSLIDEAVTYENDEEEVTFMFSDPILISDPDMGAAFSLDDLQGRKRLPWLTESRPYGEEPASLKSKQFSNVLLYRSILTQTRLDSLHAMLDQYRTTAALIGDRQDELGAAP